eukprot:142035_1
MASFSSFSFIRITIISLFILVTSSGYDILSWFTKIRNPKDSDDIPLYIWYPNSTHHVDNNITFPLLIFGHCLMGKERYYDYVWQSIVPNGYIVIIPRRFDGADEDIQLATDMRFTLDWMKDNCTNCPFKHLIGDKAIISGHSEGAGAAILAFSNSDNTDFKHSFDSAITLSAAGNEHIQLRAAANITKPIFLFDGSSDCIEPPQRMNKYYETIPNITNVCKYQVLITNATHCNFAHMDASESQGCENVEEAMCTHNRSILPQNIQLQISVKYMNMFMNATLNYYHNNDTTYD